jgi:site-specific DNA-methyltransferase (adenine-specific)
MKLINSDCIAAMKEMPENSVDSIVTDPPYELGFMGKSWDSSGIAFNVEVWQEALRVLKPGGHLIAFSGSRTYHRMAVAIEDAGFEIRDQIMWVYGSGFPKSYNISKKIEGWDGWGTALKPAHEPMVLARKPFVGTVANNVLTYGVGGLNIDGCRVEGVPPSVPQPSLSVRERVTYGFGTGEGRNGEMSQATGRFPANFIHDGSDEVVALFPDTKSGIAKRGNSGGNNFGSDTPKPPLDDIGYADSGSAARFFYCAKASKRDRNEGLDGFEGKEIAAKGNGLARKCATCSASVIDGCECPDRTFVNPTRANHHPTVKPTSLMQYLVKLVTPPNGIVLDPFMGSGSTGKACVYEGFYFIGIEQSEEYIKIAEARIEYARGQSEQQLF